MSEPLQSMISGQIKPNRVNDPRIIEAFEATPREPFVPGNRREVAYIDEDIQVAPGRHAIEPMVLAQLISAAGVEASDVVLDVACSTGYSTAILSRLASVVVGIEEDADLVNRASENLADLDIDNAAVIKRNLNEGCPKQGPFNVILIPGGVEEVPKALKGQLAEGGRLITVLKEKGVGRATVITREGKKFKAEARFDAHVPDLPDFQVAKGFEF